MRKLDKTLVVLSSYFYAVIGLFFTGSLWWFILIPFVTLLVVIGGKKHV
ncbi:MAG: hypothetical protein AB7E61_00190 [Acholeplasmataceae bacterium]